ncbi:MAG TPA: Lrp/AsnC family transcriptional regulator [Pedomonas sp.]|uniref:Lrp/AsnC family transcriptional regulator n=1 Tax=Pedomonas sp. TaxID=2976421 RepID=UPI002F40BACC
MSEGLTAFDIKILEVLQKDASLSTAEIAERVGLSQSPCWRRLQRLREEGYISRQVAILNREKLNNVIFIISTLKMSTLTDEQRREFLRKIDAIPEILECYTIFGDRDVMIKVAAPSMPWYQTFLTDVVLKLPGVLDAQSIVTLAELKHTTAIPLRGNLSL